jgi:apolipoprotein N-acyltransferase
MNLALSFLIVAFGQPAWIRGFGVLAGALGFALFWKAMLTYSRPRDRFLLSLVWFAAVQGVQLSWMATIDYMGPLILVVYLFLILAMGVQFGILSFLISQPLRLHQMMAIAGCWVIFEWMRLFFLCGFTWNPVGLALADSPYSLQLASIWGIFGLSFWVILVNLAGLNALVEKSTKKIAAWATIAFLPYGFGFVYQHWIEATIPISETLNVALLQSAIFPEQRESYNVVSQWSRLLGVLDPEKKVDLIIFPEGALPLSAHEAGYPFSLMKSLFLADFFPPLTEPYAVLHRGAWNVSNAFLLQTLANQSNAHVIAGLDDYDFSHSYNAAFHFQPQNLPYERYEKRILVPIGEYIPMRQSRRFARFVGKQFGIRSSFDQGTEAKVFHTPVPIGVSICLEETFSNLTRELRQKGARIFVNITNDGWFPGSKLMQQHFDHGRIRAVENGVPILRACNTGITGGVDSFGRPIAQLPISEDKASVLYFSLPVRSHSTLYTWWGDEAILGISVCSLLSYFVLRKKKLL